LIHRHGLFGEPLTVSKAQPLVPLEQHGGLVNV